MDDVIDRRRAPRISCDLSVEYAIGGSPTQEGRMINIATLGALLTTPGASPPVGAELLLRFHLPLSGRPVQAAGSVRWTTPGRAGVEFVHLGLHEQDEIWRYYARELAQQRHKESWRQRIRRAEDLPPETE